ncbi:MAG: phospholipase D family protein [Methylomonas sp.]
MQMINAAERTLDLQYFIFRGDETGSLLTEAILRAADRGVRVRVLIDDAETEIGDEQITTLSAHPSIEIRIFNPFAYRGHADLLRSSEFMLNSSRLDYRMHNKLLIVDDAIGLTGGRNIGDEYFQVDPQVQFADDDVFAAGPIVGQFSKTFDEFWNSHLSIPAEALTDEKTAISDLNVQRELLNERRRQLKATGMDYVRRLASGEPYAGLIAGRLPLIWAHAQLVYDSPYKKQTESGVRAGRLVEPAVLKAAQEVQSELLMITPFLIPGGEGMQLFKDLRRRNARIRILTNSLESAQVPLAQAGYMHYRIPLLEEGVELYEIRSILGDAKGDGPSASRQENYSLHAKLFVFDRKKVFIGSMNFDLRSMHLNTEIGLIIDSPVLAQQIAARFESMVQPDNAFALALRPNEAGGSPTLLWRTEEGGKAVEYDTEPARNSWQRLKAHALSLLPLDDEL